MRIAMGGLLQEVNTFSRAATRLQDFAIDRGDELLSKWERAHHEIGGFIEGITLAGFEPVPLLMARAVPAGKVTGEAFDSLVDELASRITDARPLDGVLLALHGAMAAEDYPDADAEILRRLRELLGAEFPLVVTHDLHANISQDAARHPTALLVYKTYPHIDQRHLGRQAADILARILRGEVRPVQSLSKPPMVLNLVRQNTNAEPVKSIMAAAREMERTPGVLAASLALGYQYADVEEVGPAAIVVTDGDLQLARTEAERLSNMLWEARDQLRFRLPDAAEAVREAIASDARPVILVDMGDNIGGGSAGDGTILLRELLDQGAKGWLVVLADPEAVQRAVEAAIGESLTLEVGGKKDGMHGEPVEVMGRVKSVHDGRYIETEPRHGGMRYHDQGLTAVLEVEARVPEDSSYVVLTTNRQVPFSLQQIRSLGLDPTERRMIVVKSTIAFRAAYEPIAGRIIEVDTPGLTSVNPTRFTYEHVRTPLWGLKGEEIG